MNIAIRWSMIMLLSLIADIVLKAIFHELSLGWLIIGNLAFIVPMVIRDIHNRDY